MMLGPMPVATTTLRMTTELVSHASSELVANELVIIALCWEVEIEEDLGVRRKCYDVSYVMSYMVHHSTCHLLI